MYKPSKPYNIQGVDGNVFAIIGYTSNAMHRSDYTREEIKAYKDDAMSKDYNHAVCVSLNKIDEINQKLGFDEAELEDTSYMYD